jgi:hypothetical protein
MNEYSSQMTQTERTKVIYNVISAKRKSEPALNATKDESLTKESVMYAVVPDTE